MASFDDLDAPQFSTFEDVDQEKLETYFDVDHENLYNHTKKMLKKTDMPGRLWSSQENVNRGNNSRKRHSSTGNLTESSDFVSMAEAVKNFQNKTPARFRSHNKAEEFKPTAHIKLGPTIPQSPKLLTKNRLKAPVNILSHEEREVLEFEEAQKAKVKANPLNRRIFQQPLKAIHVEKKVTQVEPFKLTKVMSKERFASPKKDEYQFHARPAPKFILQPPKIPEKQPIKVKPKPPTPVKKVERKTSPLKSTRPEPFSFEKRDQKLFKKKEELVQKFIDEEKKAREFHARPIPKPVVTIIKEIKEKVGSTSSSSTNDTQRSSVDNQVDQFKARPPTVLYKKPFEVKKMGPMQIDIQPFQLSTDIRAREREAFERKKKEMEERAEEMLRFQEEEKLRQEQIEIRKFREQTNFKANPIRNFKEVKIEPSGKVTQPISPVFRSGKHNKENIEKSY